jgi:hypothetical protein
MGFATQEKRVRHLLRGTMGKRAVLLTTGTLLVILGAWPLFFIYAFASMVPPDLDGWDYWSLVLGKMFNFSDAGWISLLSTLVVAAGSGLFLWGLVVLVGDAVRCRTKRCT